jgi:type VI secretion system protein ImpA
MANIDLSSLLNPLSEDAPCGENLEYDPVFGELDRAARGTPERVMGDEIIAAEEPDWSQVFEKSVALFERTKDLRVAVHLLHAGLKTGGLPMFASGLAVVRRLVSEYWEAVHPLLDKDDDNDPTLRVNSLLPLNDRAEVIGSLSRCALVHSKTLGRVSLRDIRIASGEITRPADERASLEPAHIEAAFLDGELADLQVNAEAARSALEEIGALNAYLQEQIGAVSAPDLSALTAELRAVHSVLSEQLSRRGVGAADGNAAAGGAASTQSGARIGDIKSRDDVIRILDRICDYFQKNEPSSPVPLLLKRAKRLVSKDFMDILHDLTPDAVSQAKLIGGLDKDD